MIPVWLLLEVVHQNVELRLVLSLMADFLHTAMELRGVIVHSCLVHESRLSVLILGPWGALGVGNALLHLSLFFEKVFLGKLDLVLSFPEMNLLHSAIGAERVLVLEPLVVGSKSEVVVRLCQSSLLLLARVWLCWKCFVNLLAFWPRLVACWAELVCIFLDLKKRDE